MSDKQTTRDMTVEERSECERLTRELDADIDAAIERPKLATTAWKCLRCDAIGTGWPPQPILCGRIDCPARRRGLQVSQDQNQTTDPSQRAIDIEKLARILHSEFSRVNEPDANWSSCTDQQRERWRRSALTVLEKMGDE